MKIAKEFLDTTDFSIIVPKEAKAHKALYDILYIDEGFSQIKYVDMLSSFVIQKSHMYKDNELKDNSYICLAVSSASKSYQLTEEQLHKYIVLYSQFNLQLPHYINDLFLKGELK